LHVLRTAACGGATQAVGTGALAKSSTSDFKDLMASINPEADSARVSHELRSARSCAPVNSVCFPRGTSDLFATCFGPNITIRQTSSTKALRVISVPSRVCRSISFNPTGTLLLSGWDDGTVRCFLPESGKLKWEQYDAGGGGVNAITATNCGKRFVTGATDSQIRMWQICEKGAELIGSVAEHSGEVRPPLPRAVARRRATPTLRCRLDPVVC
jgi:WD40 repeat protein